MATDVYVMPLWQFKTGDVETAVQSKLGPSVVLNPLRLTSRLRARRSARKLRRAAEKANNQIINWPDEGEVVYCERALSLEAIRSYAKWTLSQHKDEKFEKPDDFDYYKHPVWKLEVKDDRYKHLIEHDCYNGYYFPCDFQELIDVEPYHLFGQVQWQASRTVGSSIQLKIIADELGSRLGIDESWECTDAKIEEDHMNVVRQACAQLMLISRLSCENKLPIIFWS